MAVLVFVGGCNNAACPGPAPTRRGDVSSARLLITFGFLERSQPVLTDKSYRPLLHYLDKRTPFRFHVLLGTNSERVIGFLEEGLVDVVQLGDLSYIEARRQMNVTPLVKPLNRKGRPSCRSVFVAPEGSPIGHLEDLRGRSVAFGPPHSTLGRLIALYELAQSRIHLNELGKVEFLPDDEAVAGAVLEGRADAGALPDRVAHRYRSRGLRVFHLSEAVPSGPLVIREDLPDHVVRSLRQALLSIDYDEAGERQAWNEKIRYGFTSAKDGDYDPLGRIIQRMASDCGRRCHPDVSF